MTKRGKYIVVEGIDGVGKTTQVKILADRLVAKSVREPGGTDFAEHVRNEMLERRDEISHRAYLLGMVMCRADLLDKKVRPALNSGIHVVSDRSSLSTLCYQGHAEKKDLDTIRMLDTFARNGLRPDLTILLVGKSFHPNGATKDPLVRDPVMRGYLEEARNDPTIVPVGVMGTVDDVSKEIAMAVEKRLGLTVW